MKPKKRQGFRTRDLRGALESARMMLEDAIELKSPLEVREAIIFCEAIERWLLQRAQGGAA